MTGVKQEFAVSPWRFYVMAGLLVALAVALVGRLAALQVLDGERGVAFLQKQGNARAVRVLEVQASRGMITDRRGEPLAVSTPVVSLWADPAVLNAADIPKLAKALGMKLSALQERVTRYREKRFMYLAKRLPPSKAAPVQALNIAGVHAQRDYQRYYPAGAHAAQLVGVANVDDEGISGLELAYDDTLRGVPGRRKVVVSGKVDERGRRTNEVVSVISELDAVRPGRNLRLSIDARMQYIQHSELQRAVQATGARSGTAVTLDVKTGEVLAITSFPSFNPNNRQTIDRHLKSGDTRNRAMTDAIAPGSTIKTLTITAALESGKYSTNSVIDTAPGYVVVAGKLIEDPRNYGSLTLAKVLAKSSQVGTTRLALDLGVQPIWQTLNRFGLGGETGSGFPGESRGVLPVRENWHLTEQVTLAYGYGLTVTPLQLARAYAALANDGVLVPVSLLAIDGVAAQGERVVSREVAHAMREALAGVVQKDGTATRARVPGYAVAGKTGTARKLDRGEYRDDSHFALFAGMAPLDDPKIVTVVVIDDPQGEEYGGGAVAAPVFSRVVSRLMPLLNVPPQESALLAGGPSAMGAEG